MSQLVRMRQDLADEGMTIPAGLGYCDYDNLMGEWLNNGRWV
jgi:hypothetical protein